MRVALITLFAAGCIARVDADLDIDDDGLNDAAEVVAGTDPRMPDSDEDGYLDGDEVLANTDPVDALHHPYTGGWSIDSCNAGIEGSGFGTGDVVPEIGLLDRFGDTVYVHDFCDRVVYLIFAAFW